MNKVIFYVCVFFFAVVHAWAAGSVKNELASEKDIVNDQTTLSVGECIRSKWQSLLSIYDVDRDGKVSMADLGQARKTFIKLNKLSGEDKKLREEKFTKFWTDCILWNKQQLLKNEFGSLQLNYFLEDKNTYVEKIQKCDKVYFDFVNMDTDVYISEEEETSLLLALGRKDVKKIKQYFKSSEPEVKGMPLTDLLSKWVEYWTNDDCSKSPVTVKFDR